MGIQFTITNAPRETEVYECQCGGEWEDCFDCHGTGEVRFDLPAYDWSFGLTGTNAYALMRVVGIEPDECGTLEGASLDAAIRGCLRALNSASARSSAVRGPEHIPGGHAGMAVVQDGSVTRLQRMGAEAHIGGLSDEQVEVRVRRLLDICRKAKEAGEVSHWG